jgi:hypothetical protein
MNPPYGFLIPPTSFRLVAIRRTIGSTTYASVLFFLILRPAHCDSRTLCRVFSPSVEEWDMGRMLVWEEQRGGVSTWSVLSLVALVDPDTSNSDDDLHKGRPVKHKMTYPTPLASFNIQVAVSRVMQWRRYSCTVSSLIRRGQQNRETNSEGQPGGEEPCQRGSGNEQRLECIPSWSVIFLTNILNLVSDGMSYPRHLRYRGIHLEERMDAMEPNTSHPTPMSGGVCCQVRRDGLCFLQF